MMRFVKRARRVLLVITSLATTGMTVQCQSSKPATASAPAPVVKPAPATPIDKQKAELGGKTWNPDWDVIVEKAVPPELLSSQVPRDVKQFCPRFYDMNDTDKRAFWAYFFQALAGAEAGLNPTTHVHHTEPEVSQPDEVSGRSGRTEGLLQLTYADQKRYDCDFDWKSDRTLKPNDPARTILQPKNNLECGIKILTNQIIVHHKPLLSRTGYWSTLQPGRPSYRVFARQMTNPPAACGLHTKSTKLQAETTQSVHESAADSTPSH